MLSKLMCNWENLNTNINKINIIKEKLVQKKIPKEDGVKWHAFTNDKIYEHFY